MTSNMKTIFSSAAALLMLATTAFAGAPDEPRQLDFDNLEKEIGKRGGSLKMLMAKPKDVRWMTVYSGARLVAYDETFQLMPDLLKSVDNDSNKSFTLHLRKGHKWSDGQPFTTEDFRYWWEDVAQNEALSKGGPPRELLAAGKLPTVEIIVVDSSPDPPLIPDEYSGSVSFVRPDHRCSPAEARNIGAQKAKGDWLLFVDADVVLKPEAIDFVNRRLLDAGGGEVLVSGV